MSSSPDPLHGHVEETTPSERRQSPRPSHKRRRLGRSPSPRSDPRHKTSETTPFESRASSVESRADSTLLAASPSPPRLAITPADADVNDTQPSVDRKDASAGLAQNITSSRCAQYLMPDTPDARSESENTDLASSPLPSHDAPGATQSLLPELRYRLRLVLKGHKRAVSMVRFSPDGRWIASCSADATAKIWEAETGQLAATLCGHLAGLSCLAWAPDSSFIATGSDDKSIRFWAVPSGKPLQNPLLGHNNYVYSVAFSPKGNMLVSGSYDEAVFLWDVRTGRVLRKLPAHSDPVGGVDFVRDGTLIASCSSDGLIRVWDTATGQCLRTFFHEDTPPAVGVRFSPNGKYILAWMLDSGLRMWNYGEGRCVKTYQGHTNVKYSLSGAFGTYELARKPSHISCGVNGDEQHDLNEMEDRALVVSGSEDGAVLFWDVVTKQVLQHLAAHDEVVLGVDTHPRQKEIVSCSLDRTIKVWKDDTRVSNPTSRAEERSAGNKDAVERMELDAD